jgi:hypothetical protein
MDKTAKLARDAWLRAKDMGWEAYAELDLSDVLDQAAVVAFDPERQRARVARWTEGELDYSRWVLTTGVDVYDILERELRRCDALC